MSKPVVGILAHRSGRVFMNAKFLRDLAVEGEKLGARVYVFSHMDLREASRTIRGFTPASGGGWREETCPWPDVVIDFCRMLYKPFRDMRRRKDLFTYANHKFTYKWKAMKLFAGSDQVRRWIPETRIFSSPGLEQMLAKYPIVYVKPGNGTGGHSVAKIRSVNGKYLIRGRKRSGAVVKHELHSEKAVARWAGKWVQTEQIRSGKFMVQQGLDLELISGRLVDARLLIQKDGYGNWKVTGKVLRVGGRNSPTTNLIYGDGKALNFQTFMKERFGAQRAAEIERECESLALQLMNVVEQRFGSMIEFGLDVGIDVNGNVWLIEANPKPSHEAFLKAKQFAAYRTSIRRPIQYAMFLARQSKT
ncbi:glutathione synthase [Gordoniibacillus kamchatkensis]|uniref:Glutathione synthase n=1 Tax=Gordoniibacillus kamchatkensis TaxID=1590651 RepID=A0ABR5AIK8_9BACL|nr:YheC/YheD family protein [Paenibacillus sp. VKM B-2647]KIL40888.1 glutathione synthase [Paenibacillus sp. VKM B-2647]